MALKFDIDEEELRDMVRISTKELDDELLNLKDAFLMDLSRSGVQVLPPDTSLVRAALRTYLRWQMNYGGEEAAERYHQHYLEARHDMSLASEYKAGDWP